MAESTGDEPPVTSPASPRAVLVRSWNLFHGRSDPPGRTNYIQDALRLASSDAPDVLCLQEVPPWALGRLGDWTGLLSFGDVARRPSLGYVPITRGLGRRLTALHAPRLRSAFSGQANAILVRRELDPHAHGGFELNPRGFRRGFARDLSRGERRLWARERRRCQTLRLLLPDGRSAVVANLHATSAAPGSRLADLELQRAVDELESLAGPTDVAVLAGDFNLQPEGSRAFEALADLGYSPPGSGIDHVLVRGAETTSLASWATDRRLHGAVLLSDHAPVELTILPAVASSG